MDGIMIKPRRDGTSSVTLCRPNGALLVSNSDHGLTRGCGCIAATPLGLLQFLYDCVGSHNLSITTIKRGKERRVNFRCRNHLVIQFQIASRAGILCDAAVESEVGRGTCCGIDAHVSHHACDDELIDVVLL